MTMLSVSSSVSDRGAGLALARAARATRSGSCGSSRLRGDRLTATLELHAGARHACALAQRLVQDVHASAAAIRPVLLGQRDELVGRHQPALRVLPADQRLDAGDPPVGEPDLRLVVQHELVVVDGAAQLADQRQAARAVAGRAPVRRPRSRAPDSFAAYIATSARRSSVSTSSPCSGTRRCRCSPTRRARRPRATNGCSQRAPISRSATAIATASSAERRAAARRTRRRRAGPIRSPAPQRRRAAAADLPAAAGRRSGGRACR